MKKKITKTKTKPTKKPTKVVTKKTAAPKTTAAPKKKVLSQKAQDAINTVFKKPAVAPAKLKRKTTKEHHTIQMKKPFDVYCALAILDKIVEYKKGELARTFKGDSFHIFYDLLKKGEHPESFTGRFQDKHHAEAKALFTLKKRHEITDELAEVLTQHGIIFSQTTISPDASYRLNPDLFGADQETLAKLAEAIKKVDGLDPETVFLPCEPVSMNLITEETIPSIMEKVKNDKDRAELIRKITSLQISNATLGGETWNSDAAKDAAIKILKDFGVI